MIMYNSMHVNMQPFLLAVSNTVMITALTEIKACFTQIVNLDITCLMSVIFRWTGVRKGVSL